MKNLWMSVLAWALAVLVAIALATATPSESSLLPRSMQGSPAHATCFGGLAVARSPNKCSTGGRVGRL